ncbi:14084_t:CDS:2, partial [Racocetra fulgida]
APFLRDIVLNHGTWGVSHTRVPTESRPGHVAIIAGFYEDVSAVTKGWKMNPVEFDSVFNQSRHTWSFGSPDILPMFAKGASDPERVDTFMYGHESENFAEDTWTFNQFAQLFTNSSSDPKLYQQLHDDKIIMFLHLLGLDSNGHAHGPHSKEYLNNIKVVDDGIYETIQLLDKFYGNDKKTAYIFTSDHGMSNRGNHGDGHPDNTRTPIIAWGAGISKPNKENPSGHDEFSMDWQLNSVQRNDILQADIAPLMASLIGINYPVNSVGELPLKYLNNTPLFKAQSIFVNAKEILEQYKVKY